MPPEAFKRMTEFSRNKGTWKLEGVNLWSRIKIRKGSYRLFLTGLAKTFWTTANTLSFLLLLPPPWFLSCLLFLPPVRVNLVNVNSFLSPCLYLFFHSNQASPQMFLFRISSIIPLLHSLSSRLMASRSPCPLTLFTLILYTWSILLNQSINPEAEYKEVDKTVTDLRELPVSA